MSPLIEALHEDVKRVMNRPAVCAWDVLVLLDARLGPVLVAADGMREVINGCTCSEQERSEAGDAYDAAKKAAK